MLKNHIARKNYFLSSGILLTLLMAMLLVNMSEAAEQTTDERFKEAGVYFHQGNEAVQQGKAQEALQLLTQALQMVQGIPGTESNQAGCYMNIGVALWHLGRNEEAIVKQEQALKLYSQLPGSEGDQADCYKNIGVALWHLGRNEEAIAKQEQALKLYSQLPGSEVAQAECSVNIGAALDDLGRYEEAIVKQEQALKLFSQLSDAEQGQASCYVNIGAALDDLGRYEEAIAKQEQALQLYRQLSGSERAQADCYVNIGVALKNLGRYEEAMAKQEQALQLYRQLSGSERAQAECYKNIGIALDESERNEEAMAKQEQALQLYRQLSGSERDQADCYTNIAGALWGLGRHEEAIAKLEQALQLYRQLSGSERAQADCYNNIAGALWSLGRYEEAMAKEEQALQLYRQLSGSERAQANCYKNIGAVLRSLGRYEEAIVKQEQALQLYSQFPGSERDQAACYVNIGVTLWRLGRHEEAIAKQEQALKLFSQLSGSERDQGLCYARMGRDYLALGQPIKALSMFERVWDSAWWFSSDMAKAYNQRGEAGDKDKAAAQLVKAMQSAEEIRQNVFAMENRIGVFEEPSRVFRDAVAMLADWHGQGVQTSDPEIARWMKDTSPNTGLLAAAFHFSEQGKGRALEDAIRERATLNRGSGEEELLLKQRELSLRLSKISTMREELPDKEIERKKSLTAEVNDLEQQMSQLEGEIKRTQLGKYIVPEFRLPSQMANELPVDTAVLEYSLGEDEGWLLLMTRDGIAAHKLPVKMKALSQLHKRQQAGLNDLVAALQNKPEDIGLEGLVMLSRARVEDLGKRQSERHNLISEIQEEKVLERLGAAILPATALKELKDKKIKRLLISADSALHTVPFAMVRLKDKEKSHAYYLLERYTVSYIPSLATLETIRQQKDERKAQRKGKRADLLAFANPTNNQLTEDTSVGKKDDLVTRMRQIRSVYYAESGLKLISLPETEQEALRVASLFAVPKEFNEPIDGVPESTAVVFNGPGADESQVKRLLGARPEDKTPKNWKYVLFSTHGFADMRNGMLSCIAFSTPGSGSNDDGFLQAQEVLGFKMDTDVVMLAACETGLGNLSQGDGLLGLSASFFIAGTETVAASLWQVESDATSQLVTEFFRNLKAGEMDRAEALRQAQLNVMKKGQDPDGKKADYANPYFWGAFVLMGEYIVDKED